MSKQIIIMSDIIHSSKQNPRALMSGFKKAVAHMQKRHKTSIKSPLTITLGDEFQGVVDSEVNGIKLILDFEEYLLKTGLNFKLRYVLYYGEIGTKINKQSAYEMLGEGLTQARETLNDLKSTNDRFVIKLSNPTKSDLLNYAFKLYGSIIDQWSVSKLKVISLFVQGMDYKDVADRNKSDRSVAWRSYKANRIEDYFVARGLILKLTNL